MPVCPKLASSALFYSDLTCDVAFLPTDDIIKRRAQSLAKLFKRNLAIRQALFNSKPKGSKDFEIKHFGGRGGGNSNQFSLSVQARKSKLNLFMCVTSTQK